MADTVALCWDAIIRTVRVVYDAMERLHRISQCVPACGRPRKTSARWTAKPAAAYRYTDSRMSKISLSLLLTSIRKRVDLCPTTTPFAGAGRPSCATEPFGQRLHGIASAWQPISRPIIWGSHRRVDLSSTTRRHLEDLMQFIKGTDFPSGGVSWAAPNPRRLETGRAR